MIDFRYHLVSIVAVFLALAIGIVLGSTALQGSTIDGLRALTNSLRGQLSNASAQRDNANQLNSADNAFLQNAAPKLLTGMLTGEKVVLVTEPGAPSSVIDGIQKAAGEAGAAITGTVALQPKFNDMSGTTKSSLSQINNLASVYGIGLAPAADAQTAYQEDAAQVIAATVLQNSAARRRRRADPAEGLRAGRLPDLQGTPSAAPADRASLAVIVTAPATSTDGAKNPADEVLLAVAGQFASREHRDHRRRPDHDRAAVDQPRSPCCVTAVPPGRCPAWTTRTPWLARFPRSGRWPTSCKARSRIATVFRALTRSARYPRQCRARRRHRPSRRHPRGRERSSRPWKSK